VVAWAPLDDVTVAWHFRGAGDDDRISLGAKRVVRGAVSSTARVDLVGKGEPYLACAAVLHGDVLFGGQLAHDPATPLLVRLRTDGSRDTAWEEAVIGPASRLAQLGVEEISVLVPDGPDKMLVGGSVGFNKPTVLTRVYR
jgi:hypothetical protein